MFTERRINSLTSKRAKQPWPRDRIFKILSLDGGGIKGFYTAELLRKCETHFANGSHISEYFDLITGTSTGGIIAIGLGLNIPTTEILDFYRKDGAKIFPPLPKTCISKIIRQVRQVFSPVLNHEELENSLKKVFGDRIFGDSISRLVIPSFMLPETEIAVLKTDHHADFKQDWKTLAWKVARSTSAAPTYLKGHEDKKSGQIFIDGGVWANNPVMVGLVDAICSYDVPIENLKILSIGTGNPPFELSKKDSFGGFFHWREVIKAAMFLTTDNATAQAKLLLGPDNCVRIEPAVICEMDDYLKASTELLDAASRDFDCRIDALSEFFNNRVSQREKHYS